MLLSSGLTRRGALVLFGGSGLSLLGGASVLAERSAPSTPPAESAPPMLRRYYISADPVTWDYTPQGHDLTTGKPFSARQAALTTAGPGRIGSVYEKSRYRRYTGPTFTTPVRRSVEDGYLGILGPVLRAQVGDRIEVVFRNNTPFPASMHPHGLFYAKADEGSYPDDGTSGGNGSVADPGEVRTYTWEVPERAGPGPADPSSVVWMYHDHSTAMGIPGTQSGLIGAIVVTRRGAAGQDGRPLDVDREVFSLFTEFDENHSPYLSRNLARFAPGQHIDTTDPAFQASNRKASINGYLFGNGPAGTTDTRPALCLCLGSRVRWYLFDLGGESDLHTPHWHGNTVRVAGRRTDVVDLLPASMVTADMRPDDPGVWLLHCHVDAHMMEGMVTRYQVV